jgi:hypothetical protein
MSETAFVPIIETGIGRQVSKLKLTYAPIAHN